MTLLESCRANNADAGVTGMLTYHNATFIQLLEGDKLAVQPLLSKIRKDPRHENVRILWEGPIPERGFAAWSMGFRGLDTLDFPNAAHFREQLEEGLASGLWSTTPSTARHLLRSLSTL